MNHSEAAAARDRLEKWVMGDTGYTAQVLTDIERVCAWTRHWEHACNELDQMLANDRAKALKLKTMGANQ